MEPIAPPQLVDQGRVCPEPRTACNDLMEFLAVMLAGLPLMLRVAADQRQRQMEAQRHLRAQRTDGDRLVVIAEEISQIAETGVGRRAGRTPLLQRVSPPPAALGRV